MSKVAVIVAVAFTGCVGTVQDREASQDGDSQIDQSGDSQTPGDGPGPLVGTPIGIADVTTLLPALPPLEHVQGNVVDDLVNITFDPVAGAADYRVYVLPADADISQTNDGIVVQNALYRCSGDKQTPILYSDDGENGDGSDQFIANSGLQTTAIQSVIHGYQRTAEQATLGYVYTDPGEGRVPVWALGSPDYRTDPTEQCQSAGWDASRLKVYTSNEAERDAKRSAGWQDKGIVFYVPAAASELTKPVYTRSDEAGATSHWFSRLYYNEPGEVAARPTGELTNFVVLASQQTGTQPLMRVHYSSVCSASHDELVVGETRFDHVYHQGNYPLSALTWSGITESTILVVEALATGCPYQGLLAASHIDSRTVGIIGDPPVYTHPAFVTLDEMRDASATGEVFVNGQHDTSVLPQAIARSFIRVEPTAASTMDFFEGFGDMQPFVPATSTFGANCSGMIHMANDKFDLSAYCIQDNELLSVGAFLGQFWVTYADAAADTNGKVRLQPKQLATLDDEDFLHATLSIDSVTTRRRYPQIIISDQTYPVQENMADGRSVVVQQIGTWPPSLVVQYCNHVMWDVNAQCNTYGLYRSGWSDQSPLPPVQHLGERSGVDRSNQYDVFMSTSRVYVFFDGQPYGCADLPTGHFAEGPASVTYGDVLYHSDVDTRGLEWIYGFNSRHLNYQTRRHYDNVGFSSHVPEPAWDFSLLPCENELRNFDTRALVTP